MFRSAYTSWLSQHELSLDLKLIGLEVDGFYRNERPVLGLINGFVRTKSWSKSANFVSSEPDWLRVINGKIPFFSWILLSSLQRLNNGHSRVPTTPVYFRTKFSITISNFCLFNRRISGWVESLCVRVCMLISWERAQNLVDTFKIGEMIPCRLFCSAECESSRTADRPHVCMDGDDVCSAAYWTGRRRRCAQVRAYACVHWRGSVSNHCLFGGPVLALHGPDVCVCGSVWDKISGMCASTHTRVYRRKKKQLTELSQFASLSSIYGRLYYSTV